MTKAEELLKTLEMEPLKVYALPGKFLNYYSEAQVLALLEPLVKDAERYQDALVTIANALAGIEAKKGQTE